MVPSTGLQSAIAALLASDTGTLAAATALHIHIAKAPFTPSPQLDITSLTEADFTGSTAIDVVTGVQLSYQDPITGLYTVELKPPAGGWHFDCTASLNLPQTIYGWWVSDHTDAILYGSGLLVPSVPLTASGQAFDLPTLTFKFSNNSPS